MLLTYPLRFEFLAGSNAITLSVPGPARLEGSEGGRLTSLDPTGASKLMLTAEGIVLTTLRKILTEPELAIEFCSPSREAYLSALAKGFDP